MKEEIEKLIKQYNSDSKSATEKAEKRLIELSRPIIKQFYEVAKLFGIPFTASEWEEYLPSRGDIENVNYADDESITFHYTDGCRGELIEDEIKVPLNWYEEDAIKYYRENCRIEAYNLISRKIERSERDINEMKRELERIDRL